MERLVRKLKKSGYVESWPPVERAAFILRKFAEWFPFENVDVLTGNETDVTPEFLMDKMVEKQRGGLCYEINPLLLLVLQELGFDAELGAATIKKDGQWALDRTHALVLLYMEGQHYIADGGFGNRLALSPLPLDGEAVISPAGTFRLRTRQTEKGTIAMECLNDQEEWAVQYAFDWNPTPWGKLSVMKHTIHSHPHSPFNKQLLIAQTFPDGTQSINEERQHRRWGDGREETIIFQDTASFLEAVRHDCSPALASEIEKYKTQS
ncbi:arylamine N-acetyltransferase family protein [Pseudobacillus wudalianchiensis]|uniref:Arylamine N-acetyltransferase n=1 Tax=Pseudobacillus wudalianchiensis TaxID=1743143 RepID=A0A1B9AG91_9BACI|nr:arylamine N-acetyltransferase [Bacillus wudalianchiensis]OCA82853.1 hypothetical protein A8F95_14060 [Bacillus wudalianchiensis]